MEIRLLGAMELLDDSGSALSLSGTKLRCLLAMLALRPGQVVASDRLVEELWTDGPPPGASNALQALVSRLRRALPGDVVATRAHGYVLTVAPSSVDTVRFGEMAAAGRRSLSAGDAETAAGVLGAALALWRGDALEDFAFEAFAQPSIVRLTEERAGVLEDRIEADLRCGRHAELVADLEAMVAAAPLRERLRGQLMLALYRSGRQADALRQYQEARATFADELGLEPGPEMRRLEAAVLAQDPALDLDVPRPSPPAARRRRGNLRAPLTSTIGREDEIAQLQSLLAEHRLVTLVGPGGVGKTRLALETARSLDAGVTDGAWFVDLARAGGPDAVVATIAAALEAADLPGYAPDAGGSLERLADALAGRDTLVVLDNCEHVVADAAEAAEALLGAAPGLRILATSREALLVPGEQVWEARPLAPAAALALFSERAAAASRDFTLDEEDEALAAGICARVDGLPLALELAAARVRVFPVAQIAAGLEDRFRFLQGGSRNAHARQQSLRAVVDWSYDLLFADERRLFERLSVFVGGCTVDAAVAVCSDELLPSSDVPELIAKLVGKSVLGADTSAGEARFSMLQTLGEYAAERLAAAGEGAEVLDRHAEWFTQLANGYLGAFKGEGAADWMRRVSSEFDNLRAALGRMEETSDAEAALTLATALAWSSLARGRVSEGLRLLEVALGVPDRGTAGSARCHALGWRSLLSIHAELPDPGPSADAVIELARESGGAELEAWMSLIFAEIAGGRGDPGGARSLMGAARRFYAAGDGDVERATVALIDGSVSLLIGDNEAADAHFRACRSMSAERGIPQMELTSTVMLSSLAESRQDYDEAERLLAEAMKQERELGQRGREVASLARLASLAAQRGDHERAATLYGEAGRAADATLTRPALAHALRVAALRLRRVGSLDAAADAAQRALAAYPRGAVLPGVVDCLCLLGFVAEDGADAVAAERRHRRALEVSRRLRDPRKIALCAEGLAGVALLTGDLARCGALLGAARSLRAGEAHTRGVIEPRTEWTRGWNTVLLDDLEGARIDSALRARLGPEAVGHAYTGIDDLAALLGT